MKRGLIRLDQDQDPKEVATKIANDKYVATFKVIPIKLLLHSHIDSHFCSPIQGGEAKGFGNFED